MYHLPRFVFLLLFAVVIILDVEDVAVLCSSGKTDNVVKVALIGDWSGYAQQFESLCLYQTYLLNNMDDILPNVTIDLYLPHCPARAFERVSEGRDILLTYMLGCFMFT